MSTSSAGGRSRAKKATLNISTFASYEIATMISGLILPRFILKYFGSTYNGITSSAAQFLSMISVLTLGVTASTRVALYRSLADHDIKKTSSIIAATELYMRKVARILGIYIVVLAAVYPLIIKKTTVPYWEVAALILIVGMSSFAEYFFGITYRTFLLADQSVYISNIFSCIAVILNIVVSIILIVSGFSIQVVKLGSATVFVLRPLLQNLYVRKKYKLIRNCEPDMSALNRRGDAMMHALANIVHDNTDIIVLTLFTDVLTISVYSVYNMIMMSLKKIQSVFTTGTEPIFGSMWANGEKEKIGRNLSVFEFFANSFNAVAFGTAMVMVLSFLKLYIPSNVKDVNYIRPAYAVVISLAFATQGMRVPYLALVQGIGHYKQTKHAAIAEAVINITVSVVLVNIIGLVGVAVGTLVANVYRTFQYAYYIDKNVVHRKGLVYLRKFVWALLCIAAIVIPGGYVVQKIAISGWLMWIAVAVAVGVYSVIVVSATAALLWRADFKYAFKVAKAMLNRRRKKS